MNQPGQPGKLPKPFSTERCGNQECGATLVREAYLYYDLEEKKRIVICDDCAKSIDRFHPNRYKPICEP